MSVPSIQNPYVPFCLQVLGGMVQGRMIKVRGMTVPGIDRFDVLLVCGTSNTSDVGLHLWFRLTDMQLIMNHVVGGTQPGFPQQIGLPMQLGQPFELIILCEPEGFSIALNGLQLTEFPHRMPYQNITHIAATGNITVQMITFEVLQLQPPWAQPVFPQATMYAQHQQPSPPPQQVPQSGGMAQGVVGGLQIGMQAGGGLAQLVPKQTNVTKFETSDVGHAREGVNVNRGSPDRLNGPGPSQDQNTNKYQNERSKDCESSSTTTSGSCNGEESEHRPSVASKGSGHESDKGWGKKSDHESDPDTDQGWGKKSDQESGHDTDQSREPKPYHDSKRKTDQGWGNSK